MDEEWAKANPLLRDIQVRLAYGTVPVDLLLPRDNHDRNALRRRVRRKVMGRMLWIPTPEDFILQKVKVGRPRDFEDALVVLQDNRKKIEKDYCKEGRQVKL